jgi:hypothetical protein
MNIPLTVHRRQRGFCGILTFTLKILLLSGFHLSLCQFLVLLTYKERWRDRPCEALATYPPFAGQGANSCTNPAVGAI